MASRGMIIAAIVAVAVGSGAIYAVSPYFTESTIDEPVPVGVGIVLIAGAGLFVFALERAPAERPTAPARPVRRG